MAGPVTTQDLFTFLLRAGAGLMLFSFHGWGKLKGAWGYLVGGQEWGFIGFVDNLGLPIPVLFAICAALAEGIGSLLLAIGLLTRWAAAAVAAVMCTAIYYHLTMDPQQRFELAAIYLLIALLFVAGSPGKFSVDAQMTRRGAA